MRLHHLATAILIPALALAPAQTPETTAPTLKVYSRETIVDVTVTDNKGNPVHGLTQADFTVKEDHKPQPIRSFHEYTSAPPASAQPPPKLPPGVFNNLQPPSASPALDVLLLDFVNTAPVLGTDCCEVLPCPHDSPKCSNPAAGAHELSRALASQNAVKREAIKYLKSMPLGTRVAVIGMLWPSSLRILQGFTSDPKILSAAVNTLGYSTHSIVGAGMPSSIYAQFCQQADERDRMTLEVLKQIAADLTAIKGKKNLIWLSVGTPYVTDPGTRPECLPDYSPDLLKTYGLLTAAQVAVYPVDARGLETIPDALTTLSGALIANVPALIGAPHDNAVTEFNTKTTREHFAMDSIADATGGEAFYNSNDLASLMTQATDKGSNYYTFTYAPPGQKYNYAHHTIDISVDKPSLHLVYRKTYDAVDPATIKPPPGLTLTTTPPEVLAGNMSAAMSRSMPTSTDILFDVQVEPTTAPPNANSTILGTLDPAIQAKLNGNPLTRYGFSYSIPAAQLNFTPGPNNTHKGLVELDLAAFDADGKLVTGLSQTVAMPLSEARYQQFIQGPFRFAQQLDLPPGQLFLRIGVLDRTSNKAGTLEIPLTVPKH